jgi:sterol desaturase/sphingolipid hydroxylase (fatty acid hydroxylase superfamily)
MESFFTFFEELSSLEKLGWIIACLFFSWALEGNIPLFRFGYKKLKHIGTNLIFLSFSMVINVLFGVATFGVYQFIESNQFGLLYMVDAPLWVELLFTVMMLDLVAQYTVHYLLHRVKWMWKFHMVHHSDSTVDATTGTRHHPGDYLLREVFALATIMVTGAPLAFYLFYRVLSVFFTYWTHANIAIPDWMDKGLSYILITPNMHKFHHHFERPWTDTNFGNIFSFWDRLFGTMVYGDPKQVEYGLDVLDDSRDADILYQLKIPWDKSIKTDY